ncbi:hypothetical protein [Marinobacterium sediminicola]|uniref:Porin n=1 Tax=Marinobacterium sediminicola TaxID=518898 RepID=A0ABY1S0U7_9GAMM|nr:hypothetical protein [Marinobacterium sediminicola]ULG68293.1 hypothetical protein LN244_11340 [Marinobacterium sediminicola]SMR74869.1 hypothetical protein SAMN04487964_108134 [Marinobacterium sediminicola]
MVLKSRLAVAVIAVGMASGVSALELGEFKGTTFSVGGYVKAEGRFTDADTGGTDFDGTARQSRINFSAKREVEGHQVMGFVEGDFYGGNATESTYDWRLRHAYVKVDNLTLGQTWSGQFLASVPYDVPHLDFFNAGKGNAGGNGGVVRPDMVLHYQLGNVRLTLQDPINADADYPDFVIDYARKFEGGHAISVALAGRDVARSNTTNSSEDSEFGAALIYAGKYSLGATSLHLNGYTGEGQGVYSGFGYGGAWHPTLRPAVDANADGDLIKTTGVVVGVSHTFNDKLRGALRYAQIEADETTATAEDKLEITHANLIYTYLPGLDFGIEWRDQNVATHGTRPVGQQLELMAMYKF